MRTTERILREPSRTERMKSAVSERGGRMKSALSDRYDSARGYFKEHDARDFAAECGNYVKAHPIGSLLVGAAAGYLVYRLVTR